MWDWLCPEHGSFEDLAHSDVRQMPCPYCGANAPRQIPAPRIDKMGMALQSGATETSIAHFERVHRERKAIEDRSYRDHGDYGSHAGGDGGRPITPDIASSL